MAVADDLALRALSTPAIDASDALDVLVDVLLEAGILDDVVRGPSDHVPVEWSTARFELRRRAHRWATRRLVTPPNPLQHLVDILSAAIDAEELPPAVIGVVGPFVVRVHFLRDVDAHIAMVAREAVARALPASIVVEVSAGSCAGDRATGG